MLDNRSRVGEDKTHFDSMQMQQPSSLSGYHRHGLGGGFSGGRAFAAANPMSDAGYASSGLLGGGYGGGAYGAAAGGWSGGGWGATADMARAESAAVVLDEDIEIALSVRAMLSAARREKRRGFHDRSKTAKCDTTLAQGKLREL